MIARFSPGDRDFEVVSRLPDRLRKRSRSDWADQNLQGEELDAFLEGPCFDATGNLYLVDIPFGRILRLSADHDWSVVVEYDGWPNGMKHMQDETLLVADHKKGLILVEKSSGQIRTICDGFEGKPFRGLNDLTLASNGDIYFTDQGQSGVNDPFGRLFKFGRDGELLLLMSGIPSPNGLVLSADEKTLFLAVTRANAVWRVPLRPNGTVAKAGLFIQLSGGIGPDGLARRDDELFVVHAGLGVWRFDSYGLPQNLWRRRGFDYVTNLALHPTKRGAFYITESKTATILKIDTVKLRPRVSK